MEKTVRETIKDTVRIHLKKNNGLVFGQCLTAVGWVGGTIPELGEKDGLIELSMADVSNGGIVTGAGLSNRRPIYVIRYQGFNWFNASIILNYACKSKEIWQVPCPIFIRGIAMEGSIGPVAGSSHHSIYNRMPGIKIISPMTPKEYLQAYEYFIKNDDVLYVSEHRGSYSNKKELDDFISDNLDIVLFPISITRFEAQKAKIELEKQGYKIGIGNIVWIKPFLIKKEWEKAIKSSKFGGIVLDDDYTEGVATNLAYKLMKKTGKKIDVMGLKDKSAGFSRMTDNLPPNYLEITDKVKKIIKTNS
uniref:Putative transketolase, pyridine binding domain protein n=1 Tax=uncultured marine microorganism HF4000_007I05 TaxID=455511 RepID=B3T0X9_9ZZZZ|nr:putative transketolase, pyridine binding domain protein [uncultured marine microorganism HF4000_007I05]